ncbi:MAG TPA: relaxase domain-containing protein [Acidimicrobiales bacterium]
MVIAGRAVLLAHSGSAGRLYHAALRDEVSRRLGVEWQPTRRGLADLAGIDHHVLMAFSERRREILEAVISEIP